MLWVALAYAIFLWWFATGVILMAVSARGPLTRLGLEREDYLGRVLAGLPVLVLGAAGVVLTRDAMTVEGAFIAFTAAILIWGWFELAFLAGVITGPNRDETPPDTAPRDRFRRAWRAVSHSELSLAATGLALAALCLGQANPFAFWTFAVLFAARISAKLNVYLGVPHINDEFLPAPVQHLASHFRQAPMNRFFPVSVTLLTAAAVCWAERAYAAPAGSGLEIGFALLLALTLLAVLEHWFMVLSIQDAALWRWMLGTREIGGGEVLHSPKDKTKHYIALNQRPG